MNLLWLPCELEGRIVRANDDGDVHEIIRIDLLYNVPLGDAEHRGHAAGLREVPHAVDHEGLSGGTGRVVGTIGAECRDRVAAIGEGAEGTAGRGGGGGVGRTRRG